MSYGGGFARPRIVVGEATLETALGELPDEEEFPDRTANPEELPLGLVMPSIEPAEGPLHAQEERAEKWRRRLTLEPPRARAYMPRRVGQNATLLGWVLPQRLAEGIPLISDTEEDFGVVKRLLSEHYAAFQGIFDDDEVDDTDPTQKDFLFGAILRELGVVARHDVLFATIGLFLEVVSSKKRWFSFPVRLPLAIYERLLAAPAVRVADAYAALNGAVHHLIQYLCFTRGGDGELLTARANVPRLIETSRLMLARLDAGPPAAGASPGPLVASERVGDRGVLHRTSRDRAAWLARIFHSPLTPRGFRWVRVLGSVAACVIAGALILRSVREAIAYHPAYLQHMSSELARPSEGENTR
jgi:hypothetical protein